MKDFFHRLHVRILWYLKYKRKYKKKGETGPLAVYIDTRPKRVIRQEKEKFDQFLDFFSSAITPNRKTVAELIDYIQSKYDAKEYTIEPREYRLDLFNLLKNDYAEIFDDPILQDFEFVDIIKERVHRSVESQRKVDYLFEKIDDYNFNFVYYRFVDNPDSETEEHRYFNVGIETTSGKLLAGGHCEASLKIVEEIALYYGVTENDIRDRTNTFIAYAIYSRDRGMLVQ